MQPTFVPVKKNNLAEIKDIYDYYILNSTATFHTEKISMEELADIIPADHKKYKSFLIKDKNETCGYCLLTQYKKRQAYDRTAEVIVYLKPEYSGKGIGLMVLQYIEEIATKNEIKVLIGIISGDNTASLKLFEKAGYEKCAHFKQVGEKFGKILDVIAYQKILLNI